MAQPVFLDDLLVLQLDECGVWVAIAMIFGKNGEGLLCSIMMDQPSWLP